MFLRRSLHRLMVSKRRKVSPTLKSVDRHCAMRIRVGGPGLREATRSISCETSCFCTDLTSDDVVVAAPVVILNRSERVLSHS